ncbi:hypothetical protein [Verrucosispora sioxanthis]|uniref:hypothetical protein n=1 Tax=Verrucosispora sioxanthis TaxID=2499994 RepID=UPI001F181EBB|nr:hypothetical protein [Verrucosispora sioxanthis]
MSPGTANRSRCGAWAAALLRRRRSSASAGVRGQPPAGVGGEVRRVLDHGMSEGEAPAAGHRAQQVGGDEFVDGGRHLFGGDPGYLGQQAGVDRFGPEHRCGRGHQVGRAGQQFEFGGQRGLHLSRERSQLHVFTRRAMRQRAGQQRRQVLRVALRQFV